MTTIELSILFPIVLLWLMLIVQYGLWWHGKQVANAAAFEAVAAAQLPNGSGQAGDAAAHRFVGRSGNLTNVTITVDRSPVMVVAEVHGDAPRLIPWFKWRVTARSEAPVERFIPEPER